MIRDILNYLVSKLWFISKMLTILLVLGVCTYKIFVLIVSIFEENYFITGKNHCLTLIDIKLYRFTYKKIHMGKIHSKIITVPLFFVTFSIVQFKLHHFLPNSLIFGTKEVVLNFCKTTTYHHNSKYIVKKYSFTALHIHTLFDIEC